MTEDPSQDGTNWYIYGVNNPVRYMDPTGTIHQDSNGYWLSDIWDVEWDSEYGCYGFWLYNDEFFAYGSKGEWFNNPDRLRAAEAFLQSIDTNGVSAGGGYYIPYYESRRIQTIQAAMGINVTGWYDDQTIEATGTLQDRYGVGNASSTVFDSNTWKALDSARSSVLEFHGFHDEWKANVISARGRDFAADLLVNGAIFGGGKAILSGFS